MKGSRSRRHDTLNGIPSWAGVGGGGGDAAGWGRRYHAPQPPTPTNAHTREDDDLGKARRETSLWKARGASNRR
ncbi:hypothetical protein E2C01_060238 [Portunus trituberculatus]|uniref:Uncharacterized protein n=1 Tax=Portunus trituberculatus TaxID=210409 RepID=A0A5B7H8R3_PORTR|nr:hypothetical protein [Portunus trituberculatus]